MMPMLDKKYSHDRHLFIEIKMIPRVMLIASRSSSYWLLSKGFRYTTTDNQHDK